MDVCFNSLSTVGGTPNNPSESKKPLSLFELPTEVVTKAVELLPPSDLAAVSMTCTKGRGIANDIFCRRARQLGCPTENPQSSEAIRYLESVYRGVHALGKKNLIPVNTRRFETVRKKGWFGFKRNIKRLNVEESLCSLSRIPTGKLADLYSDRKWYKVLSPDVTRALIALVPDKVLVSAVDPDTRKKLGCALFAAVMQANPLAVGLLLFQGADPNFIDDEGWSPLTTNTSDVRVIRLLLDYGANINFQHPGSGETALHIAAKNGHLDTVRFLIHNKANLNLKSSSGDTPLHLAASATKGRVTLLLMKSGADLDILNNAGYAPAWYGMLRLDRSSSTERYLKRFL